MPLSGENNDVSNFDQIFVKLAGNKDRFESSNEFKYGSDQISNFGVICS